MPGTPDSWLNHLIPEVDNLVYFCLAVLLVLLAGYGGMAPAGTGIAELLVGALLIKVKA